MKFVFFGSSRFSVYVLEELAKAGLTPFLIVSLPPSPKGRGLKVSSNIVTNWAKAHHLPCLEPQKLDSAFLSTLSAKSCTLFLVASYGKIIPKNILDIPEHGTLNLHPSLLPKYRGPSPIQTQILRDEKEVGVTIMLADEKTDHGPIVSSCKLQASSFKLWPTKSQELERELARVGGRLLAETIPKWISGKIKSAPQDHDKATYTKKLSKKDGEIDSSADPYQNFLRIQAMAEWPGAHFFAEKGEEKIRVKITDASFENEKLIIKKVVPEGRKEMSYDEFLRGFKN
ncbi:MAG: methionyl-tRNA formyltransferase [Candidatus Taylorbacteria bacterium]|nr:methionyl-tRNA formyltransferase [Candidatus Taylorbacteria bacterium]